MPAAGQFGVSKETATELLLRCTEILDDINEPLELLMLLTDVLGADVNSKDAAGATPLHTLFCRPILGK